ncbi:MAG TPA: hypothetical protein VJ697_09680 [Nitrososphaeraceae archaeon]|nr:hypothetical protein [Nitrososphaeraceae archaeon]
MFNLFLFLSFPFVFFIFSNIYAQQTQQPLDEENITVYDHTLKIELVAAGLDFPTTMTFLGPHDFLILEKSGTVKRITDGHIVAKPLLYVDVNEKDERGLLGIAINDIKRINCTSTTTNKDTICHVFLYYITCEGKNAD